MRKYILSLVLIITFASLNMAQLNIGLMGGMNFSYAKQNQFYFADAKSETKLALGGVIDYQFTKNFSVRLEPLYVEKGTYGRPLDTEGISPKISLDLSYVEIPILFKYSVGDVVQPYMFVGPTIGINTGSDLVLDAMGFNVAIDADDIVKDIEYSFNIGGGLNYKIDELVTIFMEAKYVFGLTDIVKKGEIEFDFDDEDDLHIIPGGTEYFNKGLQVMFGFSFPLNITQN